MGMETMARGAATGAAALLIFKMIWACRRVVGGVFFLIIVLTMVTGGINRVTISLFDTMLFPTHNDPWARENILIDKELIQISGGNAYLSMRIVNNTAMRVVPIHATCNSHGFMGHPDSPISGTFVASFLGENRYVIEPHSATTILRVPMSGIYGLRDDTLIAWANCGIKL